MTVDFHFIQTAVQNSLDNFFANDFSLLTKNVSERSISQNFANYLITEFPEFDTDCEYNRHGSDVKTMVYPESSEPSPIIPDIVIHSRGNDRNNLFVIEIKKHGNLEIEKDIMKLKELTSESYNYAFGLLMIFYIKDKSHMKPVLRWFSEGQEII